VLNGKERRRFEPAAFLKSIEDLPPQQRRELILAEMNAIHRESVDVEGQVHAARVEVAATGDYGDRDWYVRAAHARRVKGLQIATLQRALSMIGQEMRAGHAAREAERSVSFDAAFRRAAKRRLTGEEYEKLCREAKDLCE
jgi:hypothetical protein